MFIRKSKYEELMAEYIARGKEIERLECEMSDLEEKLSYREDELSALNKSFAELMKLDDGTPEDCKRGVWCKACEFSKETRHIVGTRIYRDYVCGKGESCKNFVAREETENDRKMSR